MPIRITKVECPDVVTTSATGPALFKVEGTLYLNDAELLEKTCREISDQTGRPVVIELSNICFLDDKSAAVLCRMKREQGVSIEGLNLFIKKVMELADQPGFSDPLGQERGESYLK